MGIPESHREKKVFYFCGWQVTVGSHGVKLTINPVKSHKKTSVEKKLVLSLRVR